MSAELIAEARALVQRLAYSAQGTVGGLIARLADALEAEHESHVETAEIMRRVQRAREALQRVSDTRQDIIDQLRAEKGAALADVKFWRTKAEEFDVMLDLSVAKVAR